MPQQSNTKKTILVTGVGGPAGINIVRLLEEQPDVYVLGADIDELATGRLFVDEFLISPRVSEAVAYREWVEHTVKERGVQLFIPTVDEELYPLSEFVAALPCVTPLSSRETLEIARDKLRSYEHIATCLPELAPAFVPLSQWSVNWQLEKKLFLKPRQGRGGRGCRLITRAELTWLKANHSEPESLIVMEELPGTEWTVDAYVAKDGTLVYLVPRERLGLSGGISVKGRSVAHKEVIQATKALLGQLSCKGPVCIQWKQDTAGRPKFVEINPRLSGGLMITVLSGIDPVAPLLAEVEETHQTEQAWQETTVIGHFEYHKIKV
jgi:carbamoyl-phosphate synthase large subunit